MALTTATARTLAISYQAYTEYLREALKEGATKADCDTLRVWAQMLKESQEKTGVVIVENFSIDATLKILPN